jgi:hypothetical protein
MADISTFTNQYSLMMNQYSLYKDLKNDELIALQSLLELSIDRCPIQVRQSYYLYQVPTFRDQKVELKVCDHLGCVNVPLFNYKGLKDPARCRLHKLDRMVCVRDKHCIHDNCLKIALFNYPEEKALYCYDHKLDQMVDVKHVKCKYPGCERRPNFNYKTEITGQYCKLHKLDQMVNVHNVRCLVKECRRLPRFGFYNKEPMYCKRHKAEDMTYVCAKRW